MDITKSKAAITAAATEVDANIMEAIKTKRAYMIPRLAKISDQLTKLSADLDKAIEPKAAAKPRKKAGPTGVVTKTVAAK